MVSTTEICTDNIPMSPGPSVFSQKPSAKKSLRQFTEVLDVKKKCTTRRLGDVKSKRKYIS